MRASNLGPLAKDLGLLNVYSVCITEGLKVKGQEQVMEQFSALDLSQPPSTWRRSAKLLVHNEEGTQEIF